MARLRSAARSARSWRMAFSTAAACISSSSCSWPCVAGRNSCDAPLSPSVSRSAASELTPCPAAFALYTAGAHAAAVIPKDRRLQPLSALGVVPSSRVRSRQGGLLVPHPAHQGVKRRVGVFKHLVYGCCGHGPTGVLLGGAQPEPREGSSCAAVTAPHRQRLTGAA